VIGIAYFLSGLSVWALGQGVGQSELLPYLTFFSGTFVGAALVSMPALAAAYYPTQGRASGVAWMLGIGRFGGIAGAVLGGLLLELGVGTAGILGFLAVPAMIGAAAVFYKERARRAQPSLESALV
jgi:AAHS family 4-hydroxybenzoate transporter-like MFS transporter